jgi:hypothetical protein
MHGSVGSHNHGSLQRNCIINGHGPTPAKIGDKPMQYWNGGWRLERARRACSELVLSLLF